MMIKLLDENGDLAYESLWARKSKYFRARRTTLAGISHPGRVSIIVDFNEPPVCADKPWTCLSEDGIVLSWNWIPRLWIS